MPNQNLWGELPDIGKLRAPYTILNEQASLLQDMTNGLLNGHIKKEVEGEEVVLTFYIVAPTLNYYSYAVAIVRHPFLFYPLRVIHGQHADTLGKQCHNEDEFLEELRLIFTSSSVKNVIKGLLSLTRTGEKV